MDNNDTLFPSEHRQDVADYFNTSPGGGTHWGNDEDCQQANGRANPYLRPAVILDEYTKNRDVWRCPSAKNVIGPYCITPGPDWLAYLKSTEGQWGADTPICIKDNVFPPGWGGEVTDSIAQQRVPVGWPQASNAANKVFIMGIGLNIIEPGLKLAAVQDAASSIICGDAGFYPDWMSPGLLAYPDLCALECGNCWSWVDWEVRASDSDGCSAYLTTPDCWQIIAPLDGSFLRDPNLRKRFARHLGGSNMGFLDGHATWMSSENFLAKFREEAGKANTPGDPTDLSAMGMYIWGPEDTEGYCAGWGAVTLY